MPVNNPQEADMVTTSKQFSDALTVDLTDEEIGNAYRLITRVNNKHTALWRQKYPFDNADKQHEFLAEFEDEIKTKLAEECNILATVDTTPLIAGQPLILEILGKIPGDAIYAHGFDHEKKEWEVKRTAKGDAFMGEGKA